MVVGVVALLAYSVLHARSGDKLTTVSPGQTQRPLPPAEFVSPRDGATVTNPINVRLAVAGVALVPATGAAQLGQGHLHVIIDGPAPAAGQAVPNDATHIDLADGSHTVTLPPLSPGPHTLTVVFGDSLHVVINPALSQTITVNVSG